MLHCVSVQVCKPFCHYPPAPGTALSTVSKVLPFLECHAVGAIDYLGLVVRVPSQCALKVMCARVLPRDGVPN